MAQGNHVSVKGDITSDIYYDVLEVGDKQTPFLRLYMMIDGSREAYPVKGLRICLYGLLAELTYAHVQKGSRLFVEGHVQTRSRRNGSTASRTRKGGQSCFCQTFGKPLVTRKRRLPGNRHIWNWTGISTGYYQPARWGIYSASLRRRRALASGRRPWRVRSIKRQPP